MKKHTFLISLLLFVTPHIQAAEFCATTSGQLQSALSSAQSNNQHDVIKVAEGSYPTTGSEFSYTESAGWDLEISGGWTDFFGNPCGQQLSGNPFNTVLDGNNSARIMHIRSSGNSDITISNLSFINGGTANLSTAGGLRFYPTNTASHTGQVIIERNAFINNHAQTASALSFFSSGINSHIRNNVFTLNTAHNGSYSITIDQDLNSGIYFTNNTLVQNSGDSTNDIGGFVLFTRSSSSAYIGNNVLYDNGNRDLHLSGTGDVWLHYNDVGIRTGVAPFSNLGNFSADPEFNTGILEFTPSYGSPLVNAGYDPPSFVPIPTPFELAWFEGTLDLLGNTRKQQGKVDLGAIETSAEPPIFMDGFD
ncbi:hypothetical protein [Marinicella litoralis]|uniref:Parallel beta helix pectate lyase-like protein n=1 Tax=Marinicella litoralis TaxID=644220 RepID=A0A4R6XLW5_9GAMM|nr:hypothetical protein [Marinicella litoralis]TDR20566.1 hypothetical protein C8D91_1540 [Marinicella litoralis]